MRVTLPGLDDIYMLKRVGTKAQSTDFARICGVENCKYYLKSTTTNSRNLANYKSTFYIIDENGRIMRESFQDETIGIRPVLKFSSVEEMELLTETIDDNIVKCGMYMEDSFLEDEQNKWTAAFNEGLLETCGEYKLDKKVLIYKDNNDKKAVRIKVNNTCHWLSVKDRIWYLDKNSLMAISDKIILGGIKFTESGNYFDENSFPNTSMGIYLNNTFLPELMQFNEHYKMANSITMGSILEYKN